MGLGKDMLNSITGNIETAYIIIKDYRLAGEAGGMGAIADLKGSTENALTKGISSTVKDIVSDTDKMFKVQFNPSELVLNSSCLPNSRADTQAKKGRQENIMDTPLRPILDLSVSLIFDQVNVFDAFMASKLEAVKTANGIKGLAEAKTKTFTVQDTVEGFISAVRNQFTRNITFQWANFCFVGQLSGIGAQYTMFSPTGRPIRAKVSFRMRHEMDPDLLQKGWYQYFDMVVDGNASSLTPKTAVVDNLLNL